ncbi:hypothetical protein FVEN_g8900 [Fusarium venenatum]|nr:hypothetical protein FVEN_g8900 [Fusarium venenatum]
MLVLKILFVIATTFSVAFAEYGCGEVNVVYIGLPGRHKYVKEQGADPILTEKQIADNIREMREAGYNVRGVNLLIVLRNWLLDLLSVTKESGEALRLTDLNLPRMLKVLTGTPLALDSGSVDPTFLSSQAYLKVNTALSTGIG